MAQEALGWRRANNDFSTSFSSPVTAGDQLLRARRPRSLAPPQVDWRRLLATTDKSRHATLAHKKPYKVIDVSKKCKVLVYKCFHTPLRKIEAIKVLEESILLDNVELHLSGSTSGYMPFHWHTVKEFERNLHRITRAPTGGGGYPPPSDVFRR